LKKKEKASEEEINGLNKALADKEYNYFLSKLFST
jgi:hypothetical protein